MPLERIPEKPGGIPLDESPERKAAIEILFELNSELMKKINEQEEAGVTHGKLSRAHILHTAIDHTVDTESLQRMNKWIRHFIDNEIPRMDFESDWMASQ